jgi:hypothetical protein
MLSIRIWIARLMFAVLDETDLVEKAGFVRVQLTRNRKAVGKQLPLTATIASLTTAMFVISFSLLLSYFYP